MGNGSQAEQSYAIQGLLGYLEQEYYLPIEQCCDDAALHLTSLRKDAQAFACSAFAVESAILIEKLEKYLVLRRHILHPYLDQISEKQVAGQACATCQEPSTQRHLRYLEEIEHSHAQLSGFLSTVRMLEAGGLSISGETAQAGLRRNISDMEDLLSDLSYIEEMALLPKIAQVRRALQSVSHVTV